MSWIRDAGTRAGVSEVPLSRAAHRPQADDARPAPSLATAETFRPPLAHHTTFVAIDSSARKIVLDATARS
jgi:hypothetical protein